MADVQKVLDDAVYAKLQANATLRGYGIYNTSPPTMQERPREEGGRELPFVIFQYSGDRLDRTFDRRMFICAYLVKAVSESPWPKEAARIADEIDTVLEDASLTVTGFTHVACLRDTGVRFTEEVGGRIFTHAGAIYDIWEDA